VFILVIAGERTPSFAAAPGRVSPEHGRTEILNRVFRPEFLRTARKVVVAPPCMRAQPDDACQARSTSFGARCAGCTPGCRVHQLTKLGDKLGFGVVIMPEDLRVFSASQKSVSHPTPAVEDRSGLSHLVRVDQCARRVGNARVGCPGAGGFAGLLRLPLSLAQGWHPD